MFKCKCSKKEVPTENPPRILKQGKEFRIVSHQIPNSPKNNYRTEIVLERRLVDTMKESYWTHQTTLEHSEIFSVTTSNLLERAILDLCNIEEVK